MTAYLDYNATAPLRPEARAAMIAAFDATGNPSSVHAAGRATRKIVEDARAAVAGLAGAQPAEIVFTSGATEANNLAVQGFASENGGARRVLVSAIEHDSVLRAYPEAEIVPVGSDGLVALGPLQRMLADQDWRDCLVCVMAVNNETGVVQPVREIARIVHSAGAKILIDAVQAAGKMDIASIDADLMSLSAHKFGGPRGIGALIVRDGIALRGVVRGGGQERGRRAGTENVAAIAGFGAVSVAVLDGAASLDDARGLMSALETTISTEVEGAWIVAGESPRIGTTATITLPGFKAETQVMALDLDGVMVSAGSACSSGKVAESHVLVAMGLEAGISDCAIRVSLGWASTKADVDRFLGAYMKMARRAAKSGNGS